MAGDLPDGEYSFQTRTVPNETVAEQDRDYPLRINKNVDTIVFWDAQDYRIPDGGDHEAVFDGMKTALRDQGYAKVSIRAYVSKLSDESRRKYERAQISIHDVPEGENAVWEMLLDIYLWTMRSSETEPHWELPSGRNANFLTCLFNECDENKLEGRRSHPNITKSLSVSNSVTMAGDLLKPGEYNILDTLVYLVIEDGSVLTNHCPFHFCWKLKDAFYKRDYFGTTYFWVYDLKDMLPAALKREYTGNGLRFSAHTPGGGIKGLLLGILGMAAVYGKEPSNVLILSNVEKFGEGSRLSEVIDCLEEKRLNVVIAQIDQLIKLDGVNQCGSSKMEAEQIGCCDFFQQEEEKTDSKDSFQVPTRGRKNGLEEGTQEGIQEITEEATQERTHDCSQNGFRFRMGFCH